MKSTVVRRVQRNIGTAFYREYLRRMLTEMPALLEVIKSDDEEISPDILAVSSRIICEIIREHTDTEPLPFVRELSLDDYFSEKVTGALVIKTIRTAWRANKKSFVIDKKMRQLQYNAGQTWEADRILKELPEDLEVYRSQEWVIMNLDNACAFFDLDFKQFRFFGIL